MRRRPLLAGEPILPRESALYTPTSTAHALERRAPPCGHSDTEVRPPLLQAGPASSVSPWATWVARLQHRGSTGGAPQRVRPRGLVGHPSAWRPVPTRPRHASSPHLHVPIVPRRPPPAQPAGASAAGLPGPPLPVQQGPSQGATLGPLPSPLRGPLPVHSVGAPGRGGHSPFSQIFPGNFLRPF